MNKRTVLKNIVHENWDKQESLRKALQPTVEKEVMP